MFEVKDGQRTLQFNGTKLGKSTSWRPGSDRWIEFELYRTESGSYILSRIGVSLIYHAGNCPLVRKYGLHDQSSDELDDSWQPCAECRPTLEAPMVFPEKQRYWAQVSNDPQAVLDALYKRDDSGARYLTRVAERLLETAADKDPEIDSIYRIELIP
jgi:hypothetical protein